jgi:hypothetical protein
MDQDVNQNNGEGGTLHGPQAMRSTKLICSIFSATPAVVHWVACISIVVLLMKVLWLDAMPEAFSHAHELGHLTQDILVATVAAYIFFLISYQVPLVLERRAVGPTIAMLGDQVVETTMRFLVGVNYSLDAKDGGASLPDPVTEEFVLKLFSKISPNAMSPIWEAGTLAIVSWLRTMMDQDLQCRSYLDQIWRYSRFIDSELAGLLEEIRFSQHSRSLNFWRGEGAGMAGNADMSAWAGAYYRYYQGALRLQEYLMRFRARYGISATYGSFAEARLET